MAIASIAIIPLPAERLLCKIILTPLFRVRLARHREAGLDRRQKLLEIDRLTKHRGEAGSFAIGHQFFDKYGQARSRVRIRWWDERATTYRSAARLSPEQCAALPELPTPSHVHLPESDRPVVFGHYWLTGPIELQSRRCACVDYSAGKGGPLVAYRFDGERELAGEKYVAVD